LKKETDENEQDEENEENDEEIIMNENPSENPKEKFNSTQDFIKNLVIDLDSNFSTLQNVNNNLKEEILSIFQPYLSMIFGYLLQYFPYQSDLINTLDFVNLTESNQEIKEKILLFNEKFSVILSNQISNFSKEINQLMSH